MAKFFGTPYPIVKTPNGMLHHQSGLNSVKADMLALLLTNPGERVMLPEYGTPLRELFFEPNDPMVVDRAREMIIKSIDLWDPRVTVKNIEVSSSINEDDLHEEDDLTNKEHILNIKIEFVDPDNIQEVQKLKLALPLSGGN